MKFTGVLAKEIIAKDSKSEREALVLKTHNAVLILRRFGATPFELDEELLEYLGKTITMEGNQSGSLFVFKDFDGDLK